MLDLFYRLSHCDSVVIVQFTHEVLERVGPPEGLCGAQEQRTTPIWVVSGSLVLQAPLPLGGGFVNYPKTQLEESCQPRASNLAKPSSACGPQLFPCTTAPIFLRSHALTALVLHLGMPCLSSCTPSSLSHPLISSSGNPHHVSCVSSWYVTSP